jgi:hypothetical protein
VDGQTLIDRRRRGLCVDCGLNEPPLDLYSGFARQLLCESCRRRRKQARDDQKARQDKEART